ncbi:MAG: ATP phosphoribosyltransferase [Anaerolineae bacterium]|nr:ATP phosphoribosyltransferase [Anaerolineae bacterium]
MDRLRIALPKGRSLSATLGFLAQAGYDFRESVQHSRRLLVLDGAGKLEAVFVKPKDVPVFVEYGAADLGIVGTDVLREVERDVYEPLLLPFGYCRLSVAAPADRPDIPLRWEPSPRVATSYPNLTYRFFQERGVSPEIILLSGSVELSPLVGLADLLVDMVETGRTLRENGLVELRTILHSQAELIANRASYVLKSEAMAALIDDLRRVVARVGASDAV